MYRKWTENILIIAVLVFTSVFQHFVDILTLCSVQDKWLLILFPISSVKVFQSLWFLTEFSLVIFQYNHIQVAHHT